MKKTYLFFLGLVVGTILMIFFMPLYNRINLSLKEKMLWTSSNPEKAEKIVLKMIDEGKGINTATAVFGERRYGKLASSETKIAVINAFERCGLYDAISYPLAEASVMDPDKEVRSKALRKYDEVLNRIACTHLSMFVLHLGEETDKDLFKKKLEFLCRRTYLNLDEIENILEKDGIEAVKEKIQDRIRESYIDIKDTMYK